MIYATYKISEKEAGSGLHQVSLRFLADSNSWNVNVKSENYEADAPEY